MDIIPITNFLRVHFVRDGEEFKNGVGIAFRQGDDGLEYLVACRQFESAPMWIKEADITVSNVIKPATD